MGIEYELQEKLKKLIRRYGIEEVKKMVKMLTPKQIEKGVSCHMEYLNFSNDLDNVSD